MNYLDEIREMTTEAALLALKANAPQAVLDAFCDACGSSSITPNPEQEVLLLWAGCQFLSAMNEVGDDDQGRVYILMAPGGTGKTAVSRLCNEMLIALGGHGMWLYPTHQSKCVARRKGIPVFSSDTFKSALQKPVFLPGVEHAVKDLLSGKGQWKKPLRMADRPSAKDLATARVHFAKHGDVTSAMHHIGVDMLRDYLDESKGVAGWEERERESRLDYLGGDECSMLRRDDAVLARNAARFVLFIGDDLQLLPVDPAYAQGKYLDGEWQDGAPLLPKHVGLTVLPEQKIGNVQLTPKLTIPMRQADTESGRELMQLLRGFRQHAQKGTLKKPADLFKRMRETVSHCVTWVEEVPPHLFDQSAVVISSHAERLRYAMEYFHRSRKGGIGIQKGDPLILGARTKSYLWDSLVDINGRPITPEDAGVTKNALWFVAETPQPGGDVIISPAPIGAPLDDYPVHYLTVGLRVSEHKTSIGKYMKKYPDLELLYPCGNDAGIIHDTRGVIHLYAMMGHAVTIYAAQGSEFPEVCLVEDDLISTTFHRRSSRDDPFPVYARNLYTALSRAKEHIYIVRSQN